MDHGRPTFGYGKRRGVGSANGGTDRSGVEASVGALPFFRVQGEQRTAALHVPKGADPSTPMPSLLCFTVARTPHRALTNHWSAMFDQGVILVFPNGQRAKPDEPAWKVDDPNDMRDVELTKALLTALQKEYAIDTERRYVAGFSNGGMQTMMLMCHASEWFAGAAVVHQTLHNHLAETCKPQRALPMLYIHGTADSQWSGRFPLSGRNLEWWSRHNGCKLRTPKRSALPDREDDGTVVSWRSVVAPERTMRCCDQRSTLTF